MKSLKESAKESLNEEVPKKHPNFDKYYNEYLDGDLKPTAKDRNDAIRWAHKQIELNDKK